MAFKRLDDNNTSHQKQKKEKKKQKQKQKKQPAKHDIKIWLDRV